MGASVAGGGVGDVAGGGEPGGGALGGGAPVGGGEGEGAGCVCAPALDASDSAESTMPMRNDAATPPENHSRLAFMAHA